MKITLTHNANSTADIAVTIPAKEFSVYYEKGLSKVKELVNVDGFRKGHAPDAVVISKFGEMAVLEEMSNMAVEATFAEAIIESKVDAIGRPEVTVTKLAKDNDFEYKITIAVMPELELPDYTKLAKAVPTEDTAIEQKDIDEVVLELRKMRAHKDLHADGSEHDHQDDAHNAAHSEIDAKEVADLPELTDEYAASLGEFKTVKDLLKKIEENLKLEKDQKQKEKRRNEILEKIASETKGVLPEVLIESESDRMLAQMKGDVAQMGGTFEEYLKYIKKTETDLRREWHADAEKRAKIQIILNQIAKDKKIEADKELVEKEAQRLMEMYKEADHDRAYEYMNQLLQNEEVLKMLEA